MRRVYWPWYRHEIINGCDKIRIILVKKGIMDNVCVAKRDEWKQTKVISTPGASAIERNCFWKSRVVPHNLMWSHDLVLVFKLNLHFWWVIEKFKFLLITNFLTRLSSHAWVTTDDMAKMICSHHIHFMLMFFFIVVKSSESIMLKRFSAFISSAFLLEHWLCDAILNKISHFNISNVFKICHFNAQLYLQARERERNGF